MYQV
ncbi:UNVERIFIED_CONTAM: hypothetical protein GTU68_039143 [Idotea baltica]|jgi:hypothetical protein